MSPACLNSTLLLPLLATGFYLDFYFKCKSYCITSNSRLCHPRRYVASSAEGHQQTLASFTYFLTCSHQGMRRTAPTPGWLLRGTGMLWICKALKALDSKLGKSGFYFASLCLARVLSPGFNLYTNSGSAYWELLCCASSCTFCLTGPSEQQAWRSNSG